MKGLVVFYNVVASVIEFVCLQRRNKHICRYSGCCLYSVVYILASALTMDASLSIKIHGNWVPSTLYVTHVS